MKNLKQTKEDRNKKEKNWISDRLSQQGLKTQGYKLMASHIRQQESLTKTTVSNFRHKWPVLETIESDQRHLCPILDASVLVWCTFSFSAENFTVKN